MSFKFPCKIPSKRSSSFHSKKLALPSSMGIDDLDHSIHRYNAGTPGTTKNCRAISYIEVKHSISTPSTNNLHSKIYESPKTRTSEGKASKMIEIKNNYINELIEKLSANKQNSYKPDDLKKIEEKYTLRIESLTTEIESLKSEIKKLKLYKNAETKREKNYKEMKKSEKKIRLESEKLCSFIHFVTNKSFVQEINNILTVFNENLEKLSPFIGQDLMISSQFFISEEGFQNTGRFKSLADTQNSFGITKNGTVVKEVIAMADYDPDFYGELSFKAGDRMQLVKTDDPNWWLGKLGEKVGRIPSQLVMLD